MDLSSKLLKEFAKITNDTTAKESKPVYGTAKVGLDGAIHVRFDGSDNYTPISTLNDGSVTTGDRVSVVVKDHRAFLSNGQEGIIFGGNAIVSGSFGGGGGGSGGDVSGIINAINSVLYDFNETDITIGTEETEVAAIVFYARKLCDVIGNYLVEYESSEDTTVVIRFYDKDVEELYSPIFVDVKKGSGYFGIPHAYLQRSMGVHKSRVSLQCLSGEILISTRASLFTLERGNYVVETTEEQVVMDDITMRQIDSYLGPDQVWVAGVDEDDTLVVNKSEFSPLYEFYPAWNEVIRIDDVKDGAIEFDGIWTMSRSGKTYTIETDEYPLIFYVEKTSDTLYVIKTGDISSRVGLDTGVTKVSACMGYSSNDFEEQKQGIVVAYIKGGAAYYCQGFRSADEEGNISYTWSAPEYLSYGVEGDVIDVKVSRLSDFRLGFIVSTSTENWWMLTNRMYVNQAGEKDLVDVGLVYMSNLYHHVDMDVSVSFEMLINEDRTELTLVCNWPLIQFEIFGDLGSLITFSKYDFDSVELQTVGDHSNIIFTRETPYPNDTFEIIVNPNSSPGLQYSVNEWGRAICPSTVVSIDFRQIRTRSLTEKVVNVSSSSNMVYRGIEDIRHTQNENNVILQSSSQFIYKPIENIERNIKEPTIHLNAGAVIEYYNATLIPV